MDRICFNFKKIKLPEKILIIHPYGIGDALFVTPMVRILKETGVKQIDLLLGSRTRALFEKHPFVHEIFEWDKSRPRTFSEKVRYLKTVLNLFLNLRKRNYKMVIDLSLAREYAMYSRFIFGIPIRIGFNFKNRGTFLSHKIDLPNGFSDKPVAEYYLDLLKFVDARTENHPLEIFLSEEDIKETEIVLRRIDFPADKSFIVIAPGGGESWGKDAWLKRWPVPCFAMLVKQICEAYKFVPRRVLIVGGPNEKPLADELEKKLNGFSVWNVCGSVPLRVATALLQRALFLLANDGGLVHLAHAVHTPLVGFYGPTDPKVYGAYPDDALVFSVANSGPDCRPCYRKMRYQSTCAGNECLTTLTPRYVFDLIKENGFFDRLPVTEIVN